MHTRAGTMRAAFATALAGALVATATATAAFAAPGPKWPPAATAEPPAHDCTQHSSGHGRAEFLSCLGVTASLDRLPSVGQDAVLTATVQADVPLAATEFRLELPPQLAWAQAPTGFESGQVEPAQPQQAGRVWFARRTVALAAGEPHTITGVVTAVAPGFGELRVTARASTGKDVHSGADAVFLTVADAGGASQPGYVGKDSDLAAIAARIGRTAARPSHLPQRTVGVPRLSGPDANSLEVSCDSHAVGRFGYTDERGLWHYSANLQVQVRDLSKGTMAVGVTGFDGAYDVCFDAASIPRLYLTFVAQNNVWQVDDHGVPYNWSTGVIDHPAAGSRIDFGTLTAPPAHQRALHAFDEADDAWLFVPGPCFDPKETVCRQLKIHWYPDSTVGGFYEPLTNDVYLSGWNPDERQIVAHEIGHFVMDDIFDDTKVYTPDCNPHSIYTTSSATCAWVEGWADWFGSAVYGDTIFLGFDLENASWGNGWSEGEASEGRIAGTLLDLIDHANEGPWDRHGEGTANMWYTMTHHVSATLREFWNNRAIDGFDVSDSGAKAALYQNTIDFDFRDPLADYATLVRPAPLPHRFSYDTKYVYWSVVAVRPSTFANHGILLYDDRAQTSVLGYSVDTNSTINFVAVDGNRRVRGDFYPAVHRNGTGSYEIQLAQGAQIAGLGTSTITMGSSDVVAVRDTYLTAGVPVTIEVAPTSALQDPELFLMGDDPNDRATTVRGRRDAVTKADIAGKGVAERLTFTPTISGWYGVVVVNKTGSGGYNLTIS